MIRIHTADSATYLMNTHDPKNSMSKFVTNMVQYIILKCRRSRCEANCAYFRQSRGSTSSDPAMVTVIDRSTYSRLLLLLLLLSNRFEGLGAKSWTLKNRPAKYQQDFEEEKLVVWRSRLSKFDIPNGSEMNGTCGRACP